MRIKNKTPSIPIQVWEQIIQFQFIENGENMQWKEKFFITSPSESKAKQLSKKFIKRKKEDNKNTLQFEFNIIKDLYPSENQPTSSCPSIHGQIIDIKIS